MDIFLAMLDLKSLSFMTGQRSVYIIHYKPRFTSVLDFDLNKIKLVSINPNKSAIFSYQCYYEQLRIVNRQFDVKSDVFEDLISGVYLYIFLSVFYMHRFICDVFACMCIVFFVLSGHVWHRSALKWIELNQLFKLEVFNLQHSPHTN